MYDCVRNISRFLGLIYKDRGDLARAEEMHTKAEKVVESWKQGRDGHCFPLPRHRHLFHEKPELQYSVISLGKTSCTIKYPAT